MKHQIVTILLVLIFSSVVFGEVAVTVYNQNLGLVRETREMNFPKGIGQLRFTDVASRIIPTSVHFTSPAASLLEQNYEYDLVDAAKLLQKYVDQEIEISTENGDFFRGILLSAGGDVVIKENDGSIRTVKQDKIYNLHFPDLPEGLITRPTLVWTVNSRQAGRAEGEVSYLTEGMSWEAEYVAVTDKDDKAMNFTGWVNITNNSGATYQNATIKLMAGDVQVIKKRGRRDYRVMAAALDESAVQFKEEAFYEYHLYTLQRPSTLAQNQVKQISLFPTADVGRVEKEYRYEPKRWGDKIRVTMMFDNSEENNLGIPLPKGKIRVYKEGTGGLEFIGEDLIDHTPRREKVAVSTGYAFDIVGERNELDRDKRGNAYEYEIEIKLRNRKKEAVEVKVIDGIWGDWEIINATPGWKKTSSTEIEWIVKIKPNEEKVITYRVFVQ